jgi:hypothetical protein
MTCFVKSMDFLHIVRSRPCQRIGVHYFEGFFSFLFLLMLFKVIQIPIALALEYKPDLDLVHLASPLYSVMTNNLAG